MLSRCATIETLSWCCRDAHNSPLDRHPVVSVTAVFEKLTCVSSLCPSRYSVCARVQNVESAIMKANLGLQPIVGGGDGDSIIRVPVPVLDSDGKKELAKVVARIGETTKVAIRGHRKDAMQAIKKLPSAVSEDEKRAAEKSVQKVIDEALVVVTNAIALKEKEI